MHPATRRRKLRKAAEDLRIVLRSMPAAEAAWQELTPGLRAQSFAPSTSHHVAVDEDGTGRVGHADPTGYLASTPSSARRAERELDDALERLEVAAVRAAAIVRRVALASTAGEDIGP